MQQLKYLSVNSISQLANYCFGRFLIDIQCNMRKCLQQVQHPDLACSKESKIVADCQKAQKQPTMRECSLLSTRTSLPCWTFSSLLVILRISSFAFCKAFSSFFLLLQKNTRQRLYQRRFIRFQHYLGETKTWQWNMFCEVYKTQCTENHSRKRIFSDNLQITTM